MDARDRWVTRSRPALAAVAILGAVGVVLVVRALPGNVKTLNSTNSEPIGLSTDSNHCTLTHDGLGDTFHIQSGSDRCTWTNPHFSHMHRHEVFEVSMRFDSRPAEGTSWEHELMMRPYGSPFGNADCADGGNHEALLLRLWVDTSKSPDEWKLDIRGGTSINLADQVGPSEEDPAHPSLDLGPVIVGRTLKLKFDIVTDYQHGAATVWENDNPTPIYDNRDRPLGFRFDCNRTTDISNYALRMQAGVYRGWTAGPMQLTMSGFGFLVDEPQ